MTDKTVELRPPRNRVIRLAANVTARMVVFVATIAIVIGAPVSVFQLLEYAGWTVGFWPGYAGGLLTAFALWWAYLILYD